MTRKIAIQPAGQPDLSMPYPYYILNNGDVDRQNFWKGKPTRLLGFQDKADVQTVDLRLADFLRAPHLAYDRYPVFLYNDGGIYVHTIAISNVKIIDPSTTTGYPEGDISRVGWAECRPKGPFITDIGEEEQIGEGWGRRFALLREDGAWALCDMTFYVAQPGLRGEGDPDDTRRHITCRTEHTVTKDLANPDAERFYRTVSYDIVRQPAADQDSEQAEELCEEFDLATIAWDGRHDGHPA